MQFGENSVAKWREMLRIVEIGKNHLNMDQWNLQTFYGLETSLCDLYLLYLHSSNLSSFLWHFECYNGQKSSIEQKSGQVRKSALKKPYVAEKLTKKTSRRKLEASQGIQGGREDQVPSSQHGKDGPFQGEGEEDR